MSKAMYAQVFVERRRMMGEGGYQKMHDRFADSFKSQVNETEMRDRVNAVTAFIAALVFQYQSTAALTQTRRA